jgi:hypothetical protein
LEKGRSVPLPEMVIAEGSLPSGERWILRAGGAHDDYDTELQTIHPDGHRDTGGMGGLTLPDGLINVYTGMHEKGLRRVIVRTDVQVRRVLAQLDTGEQTEIPNVGSDPDVGLTFYAALLPRSVCPVLITGLDAEGNVIAENPSRVMR